MNLESISLIKPKKVESTFDFFDYYLDISSKILYKYNNINNKEEKTATDKKYLTEAVKYIETITFDTSLKNKINNLYYLIHSSPSKSSSDVVIYESKISDLLNELENIVGSDKVLAFEKITEIEQILNKRNYILKSKR